MLASAHELPQVSDLVLFQRLVVGKEELELRLFVKRLPQVLLSHRRDAPPDLLESLSFQEVSLNDGLVLALIEHLEEDVDALLGEHSLVRVSHDRLVLFQHLRDVAVLVQVTYRSELVHEAVHGLVLVLFAQRFDDIG